MKIKWLGILLLTCGPAMAQVVFTNGIDVNGQVVQGLGLVDFSMANNFTLAPSVAQLMGVNPATFSAQTNSNYLLL